jgi:hypothetical protein
MRVEIIGLIAAAYSLLVTRPAAADQPPAPPARHAECLKDDYCLCVTDNLQSTIEQKAKSFRDAIQQHTRAIAWRSI